MDAELALKILSILLIWGIIGFKVACAFGACIHTYSRNTAQKGPADENTKPTKGKLLA